MGNFQKQKQDFLSKIDKSRKGSIDEKMRPIVKIVNSVPNYYTTSCCAGRIVLLHQISGKKQESNWLFSSHSLVKTAQLKKAISKSALPKKGIVWILTEAPIMHIACKTLDDAWKLLAIIKQGGFKRTHIISSTQNKTTIEAFGTQRIEMPIAESGKLVIPLPSLSKLVQHSNRKLKQSHKLLKKLEQELRK